MPLQNATQMAAGGGLARIGQFPYQASFRNIRDVHFCGGAITTTRNIITAAHCFYGQMAVNIHAVVGSTSMEEGTHYEIEKIHIHGEYRMGVNAYDIAVVHTAQIMQFSQYVNKIVIDPHYYDTPIRAVMTGWGPTGKGPSPQSLKFVTMKTITKKDCERLHLRSYSNLTVCASPEADWKIKDAGKGAPLTYEGGLIAISCPGEFVRTSVHLEWIRSWQFD